MASFDRVDERDDLALVDDVAVHRFAADPPHRDLPIPRLRRS
jgi:hypothetical protein